MSKIWEWAVGILLGKEVEAMAVVYAALIVKGRKTLEQVPALLREQVKDILLDLEVED
ncbi:CD1375 family protein [Acutalibacter sp.]|jgi:hypothetical protein|uniref:CD1375 family protein n=1 Tax=Acutalibacter sp. TaxID=1918636 RepID=UPI00216C1CB9|nr:hypothetical protein [Acutalibacter sp.]